MKNKKLLQLVYYIAGSVIIFGLMAYYLALFGDAENDVFFYLLIASLAFSLSMFLFAQKITISSKWDARLEKAAKYVKWILAFTAGFLFIRGQL